MGYQLIETIEVGSGGAASIEFTGIPQDGVDLQVLLSARGANSGNYNPVYIRFNSVTSGYLYCNLFGNGSAVTSDANSSSAIETIIPTASATSLVFGSINLKISNYASSTNKSLSLDCVTENNATSSIQRITAGAWANTSAITSMQIITSGGNLVEHSTASIYKITAD
tara:strand:+ start:187 stop:690 length:504 start_codon:yes stop_codon:yes gene_type:complete